MKKGALAPFFNARKFLIASKFRITRIRVAKV